VGEGEGRGVTRPSAKLFDTSIPSNNNLRLIFGEAEYVMKTVYE
jgi:hypothetical protein